LIKVTARKYLGIIGLPDIQLEQSVFTLQSSVQLQSYV